MRIAFRRHTLPHQARPGVGDDFRSWGKIGGEYPKEYGFVLEAAPFGLSAQPPAAERISTYHRINVDQPLMLSQGVEVMEGPQQFVPSLVRLECFDCSNLCSRKPLFAFDSLQWVYEIGKIPDDREVSISTRFYAVATGEACRKQIEAAANGINNSACLGAKSQIGRLCWNSYDQIIAGLRSVSSAISYGSFLLQSMNRWCMEWDLGFGQSNVA